MIDTYKNGVEKDWNILMSEKIKDRENNNGTRSYKTYGDFLYIFTSVISTNNPDPYIVSKMYFEKPGSFVPEFTKMSKASKAIVNMIFGLN